jgi:NAD(P)-dependent dehydrogenase (short-subunit alcohol dehydrogenase family)
MATPKVVVVTGAVLLSLYSYLASLTSQLTLSQNRGIGLAICKRILTTEPGISPLKLFAASRSGADLGLQSNHATRSVLYPKLDIADRKSVLDFAEEVQQYGSVDVLINNAGINLDDDYNPQNAKKTIDVNYRATLEVRRHSPSLGLKTMCLFHPSCVVEYFTNLA